MPYPRSGCNWCHRARVFCDWTLGYYGLDHLVDKSLIAPYAGSDEEVLASYRERHEEWRTIVGYSSREKTGPCREQPSELIEITGYNHLDVGSVVRVSTWLVKC